MPASAKSATVSTAKAKPARKTRARKATATPRTRKAAATDKVIAEVQAVLDSTPSPKKVEKVETSNPTKSIFDFKDLTALRGLDLIVLPLIFLEAFTVNILQNAGFTVPARVAIK